MRDESAKLLIKQSSVSGVKLLAPEPIYAYHPSGLAHEHITVTLCAVQLVKLSFLIF